MRKHPNGRVDQLEDRYLGMVGPRVQISARPPETNQSKPVVRAAKTVHLLFASVFARPPSSQAFKGLNWTI